MLAHGQPRLKSLHLDSVHLSHGSKLGVWGFEDPLPIELFKVPLDGKSLRWWWLLSFMLGGTSNVLAELSLLLFFGLPFLWSGIFRHGSRALAIYLLLNWGSTLVLAVSECVS